VLLDIKEKEKMMRKTKLATAISLALAGSTGVLNTAHAVNINPDGLGEVLIYPYYTVRDGNDTLLSITNTTGQVKAVKVRFLEGKNSREVIDFNLYLSPYDMWTGALTSSANGVMLTTPDKSCTVPTIPSTGVEFRNFEYSGQRADGEDDSLDRTREGYVEIIEMGVVTDSGSFAPATAATHVNGVPQDCSVLTAAWSSGGQWVSNPNDGVIFSPGGLEGNGVLINVDKGTDYSYVATPINNFALAQNHTAPGSLDPKLADNSGTSSVFTSTAGVAGVQTSTWANRVDAVSAALMHASVINEYVTDSGLAASTDWIVTFPTKRFYVSSGVPNANGVSPTPIPAIPPFTSFFTKGGACETVDLAIWDREETAQTQNVDFSPPPPSGVNALCWEVNVITFNNTSVVKSALELNVDTSIIQTENGWMRLSFPPTTGTTPGHSITDNNGITYNGLPVVGFALQEYVNGDLNGIRSNYGGLFSHKFTGAISGISSGI
jgi:hypothetical protein